MYLDLGKDAEGDGAVVWSIEDTTPSPLERF